MGSEAPWNPEIGGHFFAEKNPPYATRFCTSRLIWVPPKNPRICFWGHIQNAFSTLKQTTSLTFGGSWSFVSNLVPQVCGVGMSRHVAAAPLPWSLRWTWTSFLGSKPSIWTRSWRWTMPSWRHCSWSSKRSWSLGIYIYLKDRFGYLILNDLVLLWTE